MSVYPTSPRAAFLEWCNAHFAVFQSQGTAIGLSTIQTTAFRNATDTCNAVVVKQNTAKDQYKAALDEATMDFSTLRASAAEMVRSIRTFAENTHDDNVWVLANIPMPMPPVPIAPPGKPSDLKVTLDTATGAPVLTWKAANPAGASGTSYIIRRRTSASLPWDFVGVTGVKKFTDNTFYAGPDSVQYNVQGQRSDLAGPVSDPLLVTFGRMPGGGGVQIVSATMQSAGNDMKMAA